MKLFLSLFVLMLFFSSLAKAQCNSPLIWFNQSTNRYEYHRLPNLAEANMEAVRPDGTTYSFKIVVELFSDAYGNCLLTNSGWCIPSEKRLAVLMGNNCMDDLPEDFKNEILEDENTTLEAEEIWARVSEPSLKKDCFAHAFGIDSVIVSLYAGFMLTEVGLSSSTSDWREAAVGLFGQSFLFAFKHAARNFQEVGVPFLGCNTGETSTLKYLVAESKWGLGSVLVTTVDLLEDKYGDVRYFK